MSLGLVLRDMDLAASHNVQGTPTLFINGHRVPGVQDADQLRQFINQAEQEAHGAAVAKTKLPESLQEARH